jgi:hypothetical protein
MGFCFWEELSSLLAFSLRFLLFDGGSEHEPLIIRLRGLHI